MRRMLTAVVLLLGCVGLVGAQVEIAPQQDGSFLAATENYRARVGADGNLRSLVCGGTEFLLDGYRGLVGGGYLTITEGAEWQVTEVFQFATVEQAGESTVVASAPEHRLTYRFLPDAIELDFSHTGPPTVWTLVLDPAVTDMRERDSGERVAPRTVWREGVIQLFNAQGANVTLPRGAMYYIAKNAHEKPDTDPQVLQVWMPQTWQEGVITQRIEARALPTRADALQATLAVERANHLFPGDKPAGIGIDAELRFPGLTVEGEVELAIQDYLTKAEAFRETRVLSLGEREAGQVAFAVGPLAPGFYEARLVVRQGEEELAVREFPLGCDVDGMPPPPRPEDFDAFWDATLARQEQIPPNVQLTLEREEETYRLYRLRFDGLGGRQFHAWLSLPRAEGRFPAVLTLPPSGIHPPYLPAMGPNVVGMSLAIAGQEVLPPEGGYQYWDYWREGIQSRETWYYLTIYAACSRAVDLLAERPEVDPARIIVQGGSQGGGLSFVTAGLNPKVGLAVCGSPGLFGLEWKLRYLPANFWPPIHLTDAQGQMVTEAAQLEPRIEVVRYGEAASFAPRIQGAVLLNVGLQDHVTSPAAALAAWGQLTQARVKGLLADPWGGHNGPRGGQALGSQWMQALQAGEMERVLEVGEISGLPVELGSVAD